jgi:two-component system response regulator DesR
MNIHVLLVNSSQEIRDRLMSTLQVVDDIRIITEAYGNGDDLNATGLSNPDVVLIEQPLQVMKGVRVPSIRAQYPDSKMLVLSRVIDEGSFSSILAAGVKGYLTYEHTTEELATAIRLVHQGKPYFCAAGQELLMKKCLECSRL